MRVMFVVLLAVAAGCPSAKTTAERSGEAVGNDEAKALFASLPPPVIEAHEKSNETIRLGPVAKPVGKEQALPFPPPEPEIKPLSPVAPPLSVARHAPEGDVELVGQVVVSFNQPMVPLASVGELAEGQSPLQISPLPPGRFRWLDTQTIVFEPEQRMPYATRYDARVPAGVVSALGQELAADEVWSFSTPRPAVVGSMPRDGAGQVRPDDVIWLRFNAAVDPEQVARKLTLEAKGKRPVAVEVTRATGEEKPSAWEEARSVRVKPKRPLDLDTAWTLTLATGFVSEEGPRESTDAWKMTFLTYAPLAGMRVRCAWHWRDNEPCPPGAPVTVGFNNQLARQPLKPLVEMRPEIENLVVHHSGSQIMLAGNFIADSTYTITVKAGLADEFGQTLARDFSGQVSFGPATPALTLSGESSVVVLEAGVSTKLPGLAINKPKATLRLGWVPEPDIERLLSWLSGWDSPSLGSVLVGVATREMMPTRRANVWQGFNVDVQEALGPGGLGLVAVELRTPHPTRDEVSRALVQVTDLGLTATWSDEALHVLVASLATGQPVTGAEVELRLDDERRVATTDARGLARLEVPRAKEPRRALLVARLANDVAFLDIGDNANAGWPLFALTNERRANSLAGAVFTDRGVYRPKETVHVTAYVRTLTQGPAGDLKAFPSNESLEVRVSDGQWNQVLKTSLKPDAFGTLGIDVPLAADVSLGTWTVEVTSAKGGRISGTFDVREYRVPEFRVTTNVLDAPPFVVGSTTGFGVEGGYFFGAPMPAAAYQWTLRRAPLDFRPPGNDGFRFGVAPPWWVRPYSRRSRLGDSVIDSGTGALDAQGAAKVDAVLAPGDDSYPAFSYEFEAVVTDANRQRVASRASVIAHRTLKRVGVRVERNVVDAGADLPVEVVVTGLDGVRLANETVRVALVELRPKTDPDAENDVDDGTLDRSLERFERAACEVTTKTAPVACRLRVPKSGQYVVRATVDTEQGLDAAETTIWATGEGLMPMGSQARAVVLVPDKDSYEAGETARILVRSPFPVSRGFFVIAREGLAVVKPLETKDGTVVVEVPVEERWMPSVEMQVVLSRGRVAPPPTEPVDDDGRPLWATGEAKLNVSMASRRLAVTAVADPTTSRPGAEVAVSVETRDAKGRPLASDVTLMIVDEAVLSLTGFETPTPLSVLYQARKEGVGSSDLRSRLLSRLTLEAQTDGSEEFQKVGSGQSRATAMSVGGLGADSSGEMTVRQDFRSTAFFKRALRTDSKGRATVSFKLPDNLTEFRVMAVATDGKQQFGTGESHVVVRQPLIVRPSLPRFLNMGDHFEASAVVNNETGRDAQVVLRMLAVNAAIESPFQTVKLAAGQSREVRWKAKAGAPGPAKFQVAAVEVSSGFSDAAEILVPTLLPATAEAFATYGSTLSSVLQPVSPPTDALPGFGGLQVSLSSTALTGLEDAARYLVDYPFQCVEQTASRLIPLIALGELLGEFDIESAGTPEQRRKQIELNLSLLEKAQLRNGGFPFWSGGDKAWLHLTAWVAFVLQEAKSSSFDVNPRVLRAALGFIVNRLKSPENEWERHDLATRSLSALVLTRAGRPDEALLRELSERPELPLFAKAWLLEAWTVVGNDAEATKLIKVIENAAVETAGSVHFSERRTEDLRLTMHSNDRTDAIVLHALLKARADHPLVEKVQRGLRRAQVRGRWSTTQANAWALLASRDYFHRFEAQTPAFQARVWAGDTYAGGSAFQGRSTETTSIEVPMATLLSDASTNDSMDVLVAKEGDGRLYYRLGLRYAPKSLSLDALDAGFTVTRRYTGLDDPNDVTRDDEGVWRVKAGARVKVHLQIVASDRRYWVAVVDPMPAGFEAVDAALATSGKVSSSTSGRWYWRVWNHTELRDDQARAFADTLWAGVWTHEYVALATTPGEFVVPPTRAEEMYAPETFGRTGTDRVVVVP